VSSANGEDLCRVTVAGPARRVDIALPGCVPFADLFPAVARYAGLDGPEAVAEPGGWVLQRLGQEPFPPAMTPHEAGLRDGELIYLRPYRAKLPTLAFDDVADVIAVGVGDRPGRWAPRHARRLALAVAAGALAAGALSLAWAGPPWRLPALAAAAAAVVLLGGALAMSRAAGDATVAVVLGCGAVPYAFLAGLAALAHDGPLARAGAAQLLPAFAAVTLSCVIAAAASGEVPLFAGLAAAALAGVVAAAVDQALRGAGAAGAAVLVAVPALALTPLLPAAAFRMARMTLPEVPRHADELRRDTLTVDGEEVLRKTASADDVVTGAAAGTGLVAGGAELALAASHGWPAAVTCAVLGCALLLRARIFRGLAQKLWLVIPGFGGLVLLALAAAKAASGPQALLTGLLPLLAGAAVVTGTGRWLPAHRPSPFWGRAADIADTLLLISLIPLALEVAGIFGRLRGLG
jgi:ESX secretion system protein EccD